MGGERGPRPAPTAIKRSAGVRPDRINEAEPVVPITAEPPEPPPHLDEVGRETWSRLASVLHGARVLTELDLAALAHYCELGSVIREQWNRLVRFGAVIEGQRGERVVVSPVWRVYRDAVALQVKLARELGLTPSARSTIRIEGQLSIVTLPPPPELS